MLSLPRTTGQCNILNWVHKDHKLSNAFSDYRGPNKYKHYSLFFFVCQLQVFPIEFFHVISRKNKEDMNFLRFRWQCLSSCERIGNFPRCQRSSLIHTYAIRIWQIWVWSCFPLHKAIDLLRRHASSLYFSVMLSHLQWYSLNSLI